MMPSSQAALILKRSPITLRQWRFKKKGPPYVIIADRAFYDPQAIYDYAREIGAL